MKPPAHNLLEGLGQHSKNVTYLILQATEVNLKVEGDAHCYYVQMKFQDFRGSITEHFRDNVLGTTEKVTFKDST
jgi:hypothetical protein